MRYEQLVTRALDGLERDRLLREPDDGSTREEVTVAAASLKLPMLDASSNDYLGLAGRLVSRETRVRAGAGASRLIHGTTTEHVSLEKELAEWVGMEAALLFPSTYSANLGLVSALGMKDSVIVSDAANHASLIDGARLAKAEVVIVPHLSPDAVRATLKECRNASACWVVTESYFSMDGDGPDLVALRSLCDDYDACLIVDEAHSLGVFGPGGAGLCAAANVQPDILVGALGKAVGTHGGFVAGSRKLRKFLWNRARSFVFSTALSPQHCAVIQVQVEEVRSAEALRAALAANAQRMRRGLAAAGLHLAPASFGPIISVVIGDSDRSLTVAARLRAVGILAQAIRPPTVPHGSARLRLTAKATFTTADVDRLVGAVGTACRAS